MNHLLFKSYSKLAIFYFFCPEDPDDPERAEVRNNGTLIRCGMLIWFNLISTETQLPVRYGSNVN
jgi:hypothetical protein